MLILICAKPSQVWINIAIALSLLFLLSYAIDNLIQVIAGWA